MPTPAVDQIHGRTLAPGLAHDPDTVGAHDERRAGLRGCGSGRAAGRPAGGPARLWDSKPDAFGPPRTDGRGESLQGPEGGADRRWGNIRTNDRAFFCPRGDLGHDSMSLRD